MNNELNLYHKILFLELRPWTNREVAETKYKELMQGISKEHFSFQPLYEVDFPKPLTAKRKYYFSIIENEATCYLNNFQQIIAGALNEKEKQYWVHTTLTKVLLLLGTIVSLSACFQKLYGIYDGKKVFSNLYIFITAQASAGKGRLVHCKQLVKPIHKHLREQAKLMKQQHELEMMEYNEKKGKDASAEKPNKPPEKMLFIPANNSTTGVFQLLFDNEGRGLMFETEGDTLAQAFKTDYGNYSDGFRKAFHHETISYYRRTDREYVDIESPCLSGMFTGTPKQVSALIPNAENVLFSRFIFYFMNIQPVWKNVFANSSDNGLDYYFDQLGNDFFGLYQTLLANLEIQFCLTAEQQEQFNAFFEQIQNTYLSLQGLDYMATIRRLGLIAFRIAMILSALRIMEHGDLPERIICEERDFQTTLEMVRVLVKRYFLNYPKIHQCQSVKTKRKGIWMHYLPASTGRST